MDARGRRRCGGAFRLYSHDQEFIPAAGATVLYFAPDHSKRERAAERASHTAAVPVIEG
ncbi:hypothetical protein GCM10025876_20830 [Demequina litorisediminis]|uniref:Uncharacterized protein n=1 Tax=Demequina litorisediminis TaxID=1849022 RepID=A0ABQ6IGN8_9MICO|nr:hypothetical protein GCM10025876_20830 [Demequina litorisediminis]